MIDSTKLAENGARRNLFRHESILLSKRIPFNKEVFAIGIENIKTLFQFKKQRYKSIFNGMQVIDFDKFLEEIDAYIRANNLDNPNDITHELFKFIVSQRDFLRNNLTEMFEKAIQPMVLETENILIHMQQLQNYAEELYDENIMLRKQMIERGTLAITEPEIDEQPPPRKVGRKKAIEDVEQEGEEV